MRKKQAHREEVDAYHGTPRDLLDHFTHRETEALIREEAGLGSCSKLEAGPLTSTSHHIRIHLASSLLTQNRLDSFVSWGWGAKKEPEARFGVPPPSSHLLL